MIISRPRFQELYEGDQPFGSENVRTGDLEITVEFRDAVTCSGRNLTEFRNAWHELPPLHPPPREQS